MARLKEIVIDADNPAHLARFWAQVTDNYAVRLYNAKELADPGGNQFCIVDAD